MNPETRQCQNCKKEFRIDSEDFVFYEKIKVPAPTFCPECRLQRRLAYGNMWRLYKRPCDLCRKDVVSRYSPDKSYKVYCPHCWWSDAWDPMDYARDYDFSRPFFEQFNELMHEVPLLGLSVDLMTALESPYVNSVGYAKQCYLIFMANYCQECLYGYIVTQSADCVDSSFINSCEQSYDLLHGFKTYQVIHGKFTTSSRNSSFLWQCVNCQDCFASANLRNKQYYIFNKPYTREEYFAKIKEYDLGSYGVYTRLKEELKSHRLKFPVKTFWHEFSQNVTGLFVFQSRDCKNCFEVTGAENCRYVSFMLNPTIKDCYDHTSWGENAELVYEAREVGQNTRNIKFGDEEGLGLYDASYTKLCIDASDLFGCVSVRKKSYCVFNKQYSKEEYERLVPKIIQHMNDQPYRDGRDNMYRYGEFFPTELSPFAYNETIAQIDYPLTREEALEMGYAWKETGVSEHQSTCKAADLPDHIRDVQDSVLKEAIACARCGRAYRIIPQELAFYRKMNIPLPRECFYCRLEEKLQDQPHPMRLWQRTCQCAGHGSDNGVYANAGDHTHGLTHCPNEFQTSFAPDRPEIIYCEQCYNAEVA